VSNTAALIENAGGTFGRTESTSAVYKRCKQTVLSAYLATATLLL